MGVFLARIGRYWDCFEEIEEYEIEVSKVKRRRKPKKPELSELGSANNGQVQEHDEKDLDLSNMQKLKPGRVATADRTLYSKHIVLDAGEDELDGTHGRRQADSSMSNLNPDPMEEVQMEGYKAKMLKDKLQKIRERRRERELSESLGIGMDRNTRYSEKPHILKIQTNDEFFVDKDEINEFGGRDD